MIRVGDIELDVINDGWDVYPPKVVFDASPDELSAALSGELDTSGFVTLPTQAVLVRSRSHVALLDAGNGPFADSAAAGGGVRANLAGLGVSPADIDAVAISHGHYDHAGGLVRQEGGKWVPEFPRARHYIWRSEWQFWTEERSLAGVHHGLAEAARAIMPTLTRQVQPVESEVEVLDGVRIIAAPGHTPGHAAVVIESAGASALYVGDVIFHPLNVSRPTWTCAFDVDPRAAIEARLALLEQAARNGSLLLAGHLSGYGSIEKVDGGFRYVARAAD